MTIDACVKRLLIKDPFYGLFLLGLNRYYDDTCPTACVKRSGINVELCINKQFWDSLTDEMQFAIMRHECGHLLFSHMFMSESFSNKMLFNVASDSEINSYIPELKKDPYCYAAAFGLPDQKGTKFYYENIKFPEQQGDGNNEGEDSGQGQSGNSRQTVDDHSSWKEFKDLSQAEKELVKQQIDHHTKQVAEQVQKMAGHIPGQFKEYIDSLFKQKPAVFNWKAYFRRLLGTAIDTIVKKSRRKESKRFEGAAGLKQKHKHKILVAIDTSGSVSDQELCDFFSEINHIYKAGASIDIMEFDHGIQRIYQYNGKWDGTISGRGGTEFSQPINWFNERRNLYSAFTLFTDGYASTTGLKPLKEMIWIITSDGNKSNRYPGKVIFIPKNNE